MARKNSTMMRGTSWGRTSARGLRSLVAKSAAALVLCATAVPALGATSVAAATYEPATDGYSMKSLTEITGVTAFWDQGYTGAGIDGAVIDTGVVPVEGLATPGKIIYGPDLSLESQSPNFQHRDSNGHGKFMAGLIAGKDSTLTAPYKNAPAYAYRGIAPDARIVSIKVSTADGGVDVTQMIAAINWVIDHKTDNGMNIRVLNISYGTNSTQSSLIDPLSFAVERAWKAGIVVVAAAGNSGYQRGADAPGLANPAFNPSVIAVGGYDIKGTATVSDDLIGSYSASSSTRTDRKPDVIAVGSRLSAPGPAGAELVPRQPQPAGSARLAVLPRQWHLPGGCGHLGCGRLAAPEVPVDAAGSGEALHAHHRRPTRRGPGQHPGQGRT